MEEKPMAYRIIVTAVSVEGICSAGIKKGDRLTVVNPGVDLSRTDRICINALSSLMPFLRQFSIDPLPENARTIVGCPDPGPEHRGRGHVLFEITREKI
jgi:uncharacterized repeat protein (TIGR04076 family)